MKLFLSSMDFGQYESELKKLAGPRVHVALILNASDGYSDLGRVVYINQFKEDFARLGYTAEEIDLRKFFGKKDLLQKELERFSLIWVAGGNTFTLRMAMNESGFDQILPELLKKNITYGGFSAGACVLAPSLKGIEFADDPKEVPQNYPQPILWDGLKLIDFHIVPHYQSSFLESSALDQVVDFYKTHQMPYQTLRDGEVIIIENNNLRILR
jgi:dipeptidase E